jgi:hypothetical protein
MFSEMQHPICTYHLQVDLAENDPASDFYYLPFASKTIYWEEAIVVAEVMYPYMDWRKTKSTWFKIWTGTV